MRGVGRSFTGRELDSELLADGDFTFDLDAKDISAADRLALELASCCVAVSGHMTLFASCRNFRNIFADLGKSALMQIAKLMSSLAKGPKIMMTKVQ